MMVGEGAEGRDVLNAGVRKTAAKSVRIANSAKPGHRAE
jgi:hypothetical protein